MSVASPDKTSSRDATPSWWPALLLAACLGLALAGFAWFTYGKALTEKTLTTLAMPIGTLWLITSGRLLQLILLRLFGSGRQNGRSGILALSILWVAMMVFGTRALPRMLARWIETSVPNTYNPASDGPLDVVVVLGGGTSAGPWRPQASGVGDRLVMAAELYHQNFTRKLITTGQTTEGVSDMVLDPSEQTEIIWKKIAIKPEDIRKIGGRNTYEEMQQLKQIWPELAGQRVGLLTSALHLPRAVRLAKAQGLEMIPIAADVRTAVDDWGLLNFIPSAGNFADLSSTQHEIMAWFVSR